MVILIESILLCLLFTFMVFIMSRDPIRTIYNYPPKIVERVKGLDIYKDKIPTNNNKIFIKLIASFLFLVIICLVLIFINHCNNFIDSFFTGFILWSIVNLYDLIVLDIIWFCHDKYFIIKGTEDMINEYHNYLFHIIGFFIGEAIALVICSLSGLIIEFIV